MPKRTDIKKILIIGSGPIVIGQACEFDYSGCQACKALKEDGYEVVLVNSNPATIMTDPETADKVYIEPITVDVVAKIIEREKPDAILPTMGGQTALNTAIGLHEAGVLEEFNVELLGAKIPSIMKAEDREQFNNAMRKIGLEVTKSIQINSYDMAMAEIKNFSYPIIVRPSFTMGGTGGGISYNRDEYEAQIRLALESSPTSEVLIEESVIGWKEFELEVMRDTKDNVVIICSIENIDPMGVHTGDSITVAPAQTLTDKEYQIMRDASLKIIREIGVDTGGSNIQFAQNPDDGRLYIIEMNPRVSRSSALASKATGFPIARIATKLAVGYTLDEISNDITKKTPAAFEPTIDYVVTKFPRFVFEKFEGANDTLTTQMKSVGEAMSIGRTFKESFHKAIRSLEQDTFGFEKQVRKYRMGLNLEPTTDELDFIKKKLQVPNAERPWYLAEAFRAGLTIEDVFDLTKIDRWFLRNIYELVQYEFELYKEASTGTISKESLFRAKEIGFSDVMLKRITGKSIKELKELYKSYNIEVSYKMVDTCGAEFESTTPYFYSTYERPFYNLEEGDNADDAKVACEAMPTKKKKVMILGSGPNRIGQGIEFDYCCVHASYALREENVESIMVNCNPETVSTDYDTSDRLYFEPLTFEDVMKIVDKEKPDGVIVQLGGQTPLKLALPLQEAGVKILGTDPDAIDEAEDRERFDNLLIRLELKKPESGIARSKEEAIKIADRISYPVMVRPSYVLGGRAMRIVYNEESLNEYMEKAVDASPEHPVLVDAFLQNAIEVDVDCLSDGKDVVVAGIMEHIEEAGVHSGDSACSLPPYSLKDSVLEEIKKQAKSLALELKVIGLMNIQFAIKDDTVYLIEVNPRASRTVPFVSKAIGKPLARIATKLMLGKTLKELNFTKEIIPKHISVKEAVFPFLKFPGVDTILGPEMRSTGEVMGIDEDFGSAFAKAQIAASNPVPLSGTVFISVRDDDKDKAVEVSRNLTGLGFKIIATKGTLEYLKKNNVEAELVHKVSEGRPHSVDKIKSNEIDMIVNTSFGEISTADSFSMRRASIDHNVPYFTTMSAALAASEGIKAIKEKGLNVKTIQEYNK